ncbi:MAG: hypothetical protein EXX96DRAFT_590614 [Benjaminiella poitrasii]|nr:MAG: hypothetical protein EXX96DRAFT_590614 [Benjaminiella poitrasii]
MFAWRRLCWLRRLPLTQQQQLIRRYITLPSSRDAEAIVPFVKRHDPHTLLHKLAHDGRSEQAQTVYDQALQRSTQPSIYRDLMVAYVNDRAMTDAISIYRELRQVRPTLLTDETCLALIKALARQPPTIDPNNDQITITWTLSNDDDDDDNLELEVVDAMMLVMNNLHDSQHRLKVYEEMVRYCGRYRDAESLERVHRRMRMDGVLDWTPKLVNTCLEAYCAVGDVVTACELWQMHGGDAEIVLKACLERGLKERSDWIKQKINKS